MARTKRIRFEPFQWAPFSNKQKKLLTWWTEKSPYKDHDIIIADGAIRSGKTVSMIDSFITWSLHTHKNKSFIIAGRSMGALKRNVLKPMFEILTSKGIEFTYIRTEDPRIEIGSNTYYLFGAVHEGSQDTLQGLTAAGAFADEVALFPRNFVEQMIGRCSDPLAKIFMNCNPQGPKHWFKVEYIDQAKEKMILYLHFTMNDNLTLSEKVKERYRRMFTGAFYKRYILGLWAIAEGIIYDMFDPDKHLINAEPMQEEYAVSIDYATSSVMTFGLYGVRNNAVTLLKEYYWNAKEQKKQKTDGEFAQDLVEFVEGYPIKYFYLDPSASSFKAEMRKQGLNNIKDADNDVVNGIRLVSTFLNTGRFFINKTCTDTIREIGGYIWDKKAQERGEDKPVKTNDHAMDRDRYFIYTRFKNEKDSTIKERYKRYLGKR